jgi:N-dimethylarginine dimethylaminohydrolase
MLQLPSHLDYPSFLLNFPFTVNNSVINNDLMIDFKQESYNYPLAFSQFFSLYSSLSPFSLIYLLPSSGNYQDQVFVANLGCYLPHNKGNIIVLSNFKSQPRIGEDRIGRQFFESMKYTVIQPPTTFEGEADLKYLHNNIYVGGYGIRTDRLSLDWISDVTGAVIIPVKMKDPRLYHFDCLLLPISFGKALVATSEIEKEDLKNIENVVEVISVPKDYIHAAWTNSLVIGSKVFFYSPARNFFEDFSRDILHLDPIYIDLTEFEKSGAGLSCMVMHLNYKGRK